MNLTTLVERACLEAGYNDTDDVAAGKKFARHWDEHIYNHALWKDALVTVNVSVDPDTNADHAAGVVFLPELIDRVVAVRSADGQILVRDQGHYYRMDYDSFAASGSPLEFSLLPPAWFTWRVSTGNTGLTIAGAGDDSAVPLKLVWLDGAGLRTITVTTIGAGLTLTPASADSITLLAAYKAATVGDVTLAETDASVIATLALALEASPSYARIQMMPKPTVAVTLRVLGKAKYLPLDFDEQEPALRNLTNCLLAFVRGSLKRRGGETAGAQTEFAEANALLKQVAQIEALQAANNQRFTPETGYGPEYGIGPTSGMFM